MSILSNKGKGGNSSAFAGIHQILNGLQASADGLTGLSVILNSILNATIAHQDMEILLVRDTGNGDLVVQQIREYDETTQTWSTSYQKVDGSPYVAPELVGPLVYLDPSAILNLMLAEILAQGLTLDDIELNTDDVATETTLNTMLTTVGSILAQLDVDLSTRASEATLTGVATDLALIYTNLQLNTISVANIDTKLAPQARTHITLSSSAVGAVPLGSLCGSVLNAGNAAGVWNGIPIPAGVSIPWQPIGNRDVYGVIPFDGSGTTLIIEFTL